MINLGKVTPGSTLYVPFDSFAGSTGASITISGLAVGDIQIYKDGGTTQRGSTSGFTLLDTDGIDFDGLTGIHGFSIDLADNTTADFYAAGSKYWVVVSTITVDSQTVSFVAATFTIGHEGSSLDTTIATLAGQTSFTLTSGPAEDDALNGRWVVIHDAASAVQQAWAIISDYTGSTKTVTLAAAPTFTIAAKDNISVMGPAPLQPTVAARTLDVSAGGEAGVDWANVGSPTTTLNLSGTTVKTATDVETDTADIQSRIGTPTNLGGGASLAANLSDIEAQTDDIGTAGAGLTAIPWNSSWDAEVQSEVDDALVAQNLDHLVKIAVDTDFATTVHLNSVVGHMADNGTTATFDRTTDSQEAVRDIIGTPSNLGGGATVAANLSDIEGQTDDIGAAGAGLTAVPWNAAWDAEVQSEAEDAIVVHRLDELLNADSDIDGAAPPTVGSVFHELMSKTAGSFTFDQTTDSNEALRDRGDAAWTGLDAAGTRSAVGLASANLDTQLGTIDDFLDTEVAAILAAVDTEVAAIKAKTDNLPAAPAAVGDIPTVAQIWTTVLTEAYRSAGAAGTAAQLMHEILQNLTEFTITGTTKTVKKFDGSTTAKTYTLNDGSTPTGITETT